MQTEQRHCRISRWQQLLWKELGLDPISHTRLRSGSERTTAMPPRSAEAGACSSAPACETHVHGKSIIDGTQHSYELEILEHHGTHHRILAVSEQHFQRISTSNTLAKITEPATRRHGVALVSRVGISVENDCSLRTVENGRPVLASANLAEAPGPEETTESM